MRNTKEMVGASTGVLILAALAREPSYGYQIVKSINDLANMPSKEEIFSKLLFLINAPAQRLVTAMNAVGRNLAVVVDQGCKENKFQ